MVLGPPPLVFLPPSHYRRKLVFGTCCLLLLFHERIGNFPGPIPEPRALAHAFVAYVMGLGRPPIRTPDSSWKPSSRRSTNDLA
ncbi:hypothetical protein ARMSODRAFT_460341 [Armillaria solidipes]|uniref:Uncharacterized protein n=1 Tax=Armillaria solidipes TaxID=1076256 RepID=A0A2H3BJI8_9AGAR|nr:hypothetical protein ARMSODRAFT_460341 [Armillaria solidipes]